MSGSYDSTLTDVGTCCELFPTALIRSIPLRAERSDYEPEVTAKVLKRGHRIYGVRISCAGREPHEGKKISWRDGIPALLTLI